MLYKLDDKLPGCRLSQEEWEELREMTIPYEGHLKEMDLAPVKQRFSELREKYGSGENEGTCWLCGTSPVLVRGMGLCRACYRYFFEYGKGLRRCGRVQGNKYSNTLCTVCGERPAITLGMCRRCYHLRQKNGLKDAQELSDFLNRGNGVLKNARE